jgi:diguanylate cyclase
MDESGAPRPGRSRPGPAAALWRDRVLIGLVLLIAGSAAGFGLGLGGLGSQVLACWVALAGLHVGLAVMASGVSRAPGAATATRRVWAAVGFAGAVYAVGDAVQLAMLATEPMSLLVALGGPVQSVSVLIGTGVLVVVMLTSPIGLESRRDRVHFWLDVAIVMVAATTFGSYAYVPDGGSKLVAVLLSLLIGPGLFLVGVFAIVKLILSPTPPFSRLAGMILGAAATLEALAQASSRLMIDSGRVSWQLGVTVIASALLAGSARAQQVQVRFDPDVLRPRLRSRFSVLPYAAIAATYGLLVWVLAEVGLNAHMWIVVGGAIASTGLVVGRQLVAFTDNTRLLDELDAKVRELHQTLRERDLLATELRHKAFHDPLTHLPNRAMFDSRLQDALSAKAGSTGHLTLMIVDLDDFKQVNDQFGHPTGDELLVVTAQRLRNCVREVDLVARLGGDEFAILLMDVPDEAERIAARIVEALSAPVTVSDVTASVSASVGVVVSDGGPRTAEQLLHDADTAMYAAKHSGKGRYSISPATR